MYRVFHYSGFISTLNELADFKNESGILPAVGKTIAIKPSFRHRNFAIKH